MDFEGCRKSTVRVLCWDNSLTVVHWRVLVEVQKETHMVHTPGSGQSAAGWWYGSCSPLVFYLHSVTWPSKTPSKVTTFSQNLTPNHHKWTKILKNTMTNQHFQCKIKNTHKIQLLLLDSEHLERSGPGSGSGGSWVDLGWILGGSWVDLGWILAES